MPLLASRRQVALSKIRAAVAASLAVQKSATLLHEELLDTVEHLARFHRDVFCWMRASLLFSAVSGLAVGAALGALLFALFPERGGLALVVIGSAGAAPVVFFCAGQLWMLRQPDRHFDWVLDALTAACSSKPLFFQKWQELQASPLSSKVDGAFTIGGVLDHLSEGLVTALFRSLSVPPLLLLLLALATIVGGGVGRQAIAVGFGAVLLLGSVAAFIVAQNLRGSLRRRAEADFMWLRLHADLLFTPDPKSPGGDLSLAARAVAGARAVQFAVGKVFGRAKE